MHRIKRAENYSNFDWLQHNLDVAIEQYLQLSNKDVINKVSYQNDAAEYRLHYEAGGEGIQRAHLYRRKIDLYENEEALVKAVISDCEAAFEKANKKTPVTQVTKLAGAAYHYVTSQLSLFNNNANVAKVLPPVPADTDANLGDSEVLRDMLVRALFEHYRLALQDHEFFEKEKLMNPASAAANANKFSKRQFLAVKTHADKLWPEQKTNENQQWHHCS